MKTHSRRSFMRLAGGTITACMVPTSLIMKDDAKRVWEEIDWCYAIRDRDATYRRFTQNLIENVSNGTGISHEELLKSMPKAD